jgi:tRNA (guanine37-N1)-methyltransferase
MFDPFWEHGIIRRAIQQRKITASAVNIRDFASGKHKITDDRPYGGGCGMVMKPEPIAGAIRAAKNHAPVSKTILVSPQGRIFDQHYAQNLSTQQGLIFVCGRYEGVDERICHDFIDEEVSIGDFVLTGGELAAMVIMDAVVRLIPGVLGSKDSAKNDSFSNDLLEHAHFTRPQSFEGSEVPTVLLSGNHKEIEKWRMETALIRTFLKRPDLLERHKLNSIEINVLKNWCQRLEDIVYAQTLRCSDALPGGQQKR